MAGDEAPIHIDQVFAEGTLIDEAIEVAAAEAIERHRQAEVPLVISRDGRTVGVSAEQLDETSTSSEFLLNGSELGARRSAKGLLSWVDTCLSTINACPRSKRAALLHEGPFKMFYEEMYPFALFVRHLYAGREDVFCSLNSAHAPDVDYDALIQGGSDSSSTTFVQLTTTAFDRDESRRMRHFLKWGRVSAFGKVRAAGEVENEFVAHDELLNHAFMAIERQVDRKSRFSYGPNYVLVVSFDDWLWFGTSSDVAALTNFITGQLTRQRLNVATLYVLGLSGRTFLTFPVLRK